MTHHDGEPASEPGPEKGSAPLGSAPPSSFPPKAPKDIPPPSSSLDRWATALREALAGVLADEEVDVTAGDEPGVFEVSTDEWTLRVEGLADAAGADPSDLTEQGPEPGRVTAWLAVDDEPDDPTRYPAVRRSLMSPGLDRALAAADAALDGALRAALVAGADPFSQDLVRALGRD